MTQPCAHPDGRDWTKSLEVISDLHLLIDDTFSLLDLLNMYVPYMNKAHLEMGNCTSGNFDFSVKRYLKFDLTTLPSELSDFFLNSF